MKFTDPHGTVLNKDEFIAGVENLFDMFDDVEFEDSEYSDYDGLAVETTITQRSGMDKYLEQI